MRVGGIMWLLWIPRADISNVLPWGVNYMLSGGEGGGDELNTVEVYNPIDNSWEGVAPMDISRNWRLDVLP